MSDKHHGVNGWSKLFDVVTVSLEVRPVRVDSRQIKRFFTYHCRYCGETTVTNHNTCAALRNFEFHVGMLKQRSIIVGMHIYEPRG